MSFGKYFLDSYQKNLKTGADAYGRERDAQLKELLLGKQNELQMTNQETNLQKIKELTGEGGQFKGQNITLNAGGGVSVSARDPLIGLLRKEQMENLQNERERKALQDLADRSTKAGTAQIVPGLRRAQKAIPGLFTEGNRPKLKSVGGWKNLIPTGLAPVAEDLKILPEGSATERTALQELQNVKIYDSSGKQINEEEMKRIAKGMGLRGMFDSEDVIDALNQMGYTTLQKQKQVSAGADSKALDTFRNRGGLAGYETLPELLGASAEGLPERPQQQEKQVVRKQYSKSRNKTRIIYSDGSQEIVDGQQ